MTKALQVDTPKAIFGVHRDTRFKSRFNIHFTEKKYIDQIYKEGMQIGETKISPRNYDVSGPTPNKGYIPNLPLYAINEEVRELLTKHGQVVYLAHRQRRDRIRIGGWNFLIHLNGKMADFVTYDDQNYDIIYEGKVRRCNKFFFYTEATSVGPSSQNCLKYWPFQGLNFLSFFFFCHFLHRRESHRGIEIWGLIL